MFIKRLSFWFAVAGMVLLPYGSARAIETMADYTDYPIFMTNTVTPNVLIVLDNSGSMNSMAYGISNGRCLTDDPINGDPTSEYYPAVTYYGYFTSTFNYSYDGNDFNISAGGSWSGNFLNWATMRRVDVGRKVMMGGLATSRTGGGNQTNIGDNGSGWFVYKWGCSTNAASLAPYVGSDIAYVLDNGDLNIWDGSVNGYVDSFNIRIKKDVVQEPGDFVNGNLAGLLQKVENKARWGLEFFNNGRGLSEGGSQANDGGTIVQPIVGTGYGVNMITDLQNTPANTWTPLAEAMYIAAGYYANDGSMRYMNGNYNTSQQFDPMYFGDLATPQYVPCPKNFVILITDGEPTMDSNIPSSPPGAYPNNCAGGSLRDCDNDGNDPVPVASYYQSNYLDDVTLWAHTTDLRPTLAGSQNIDFYMVYAFGNDPTAEQILKDAAKNGAFEDSNGNNFPDIQTEYDKDLDGIPDTYYQASDGASLETELMSAITDILKRSTSGTAISVLATSATGAGNIFQAYFLPSKTIVDASGSRDVTWLGHLLSLNIDANGSLRDNSNTCIKFAFDAAAGETVVQTIPEANGVCDPGGTTSGGTPLTSFTGYVWDAGEKLLTKDASTRNIYTFMDANRDGLPQGGEFIPFTTADAGALQKYLRTSTVAESADVINFIRGADVAGYRDRTIAQSGTDYEWKLGDIVHSTPTVVAAPLEAYGLIYQDASFTSFYNANKARKAVVYVGANDGMLHAFCGDSTGCPTGSDGDELWAYIPYNLLPHLKWLTDPSYTHVNYVDFKMKVSDVQVGGSWKTVLIGGMRMGGGQISDETYDVDGDGDTPATNLRKWESAYFAIDITNPSTPVLLWEFTHPDLGFTMSYPAVAKVGSKWFAIFGSGSRSEYTPDYEGNPNQAAKLFVIDIDDGSMDATFQVQDSTSFFATPVSVDMDFDVTTGTDYNVEAIYIGETYYTPAGGGSWNSRMWRLVTNSDPTPANWDMYNFFNPDNGQQIVAAPSLAIDELKQQWIYFGTGKYYSDADKSTTDGQTVYGMKDPCWNPDRLNPGWKGPIGSAAGSCTAGSGVSSSNPSPSVSKSDLINTTNVVVESGGVIQGGIVGGTVQGDTFDKLSDEMEDDTIGNTLGGWYVTLDVAGERSLNKPTVAGGLVLYTTFIPNSDMCGFSGNSYFNVRYYTTGTAYKTSVIGCAGGDDLCNTTNAIVLNRTESSSVGMASEVALHRGRQAGTQAYVQLSTGEAMSISVGGPPGSTSGVISWRDL